MATKFGWNPQTFQYEDPTFGGGLTGSIVPYQPAAQQFGLAAQSLFPFYEDRPALSRYIQSAAQPLYGQYLSSYGGYLGEDPEGVQIKPEESFAKWLRQQPKTAGAPGGIQMGGVGRFGGVEGGMALEKPGSWEDIIQVARSMSPSQRWQGELPAINPQLSATWAPALTDPAQAAALAAYATYDPQAGTIFGRMRQAGIGRAQQQWLGQEEPGATTADWLAYITSGQAAGTPYAVPVREGFGNVGAPTARQLQPPAGFVGFEDPEEDSTGYITGQEDSTQNFADAAGVDQFAGQNSNQGPPLTSNQLAILIERRNAELEAQRIASLNRSAAASTFTPGQNAALIAAQDPGFNQEQNLNQAAVANQVAAANQAAVVNQVAAANQVAANASMGFGPEPGIPDLPFRQGSWGGATSPTTFGNFGNASTNVAAQAKGTGGYGVPGAYFNPSNPSESISDAQMEKYLEEFATSGFNGSFEAFMGWPEVAGAPQTYYGSSDTLGF